MKKSLFLITAFLFAFQLSNAQTEKGTQNLGINLGASYSTSQDFVINISDNSTYTLNSKISSFDIGPNYSYFIADKLDIGINLSYNNSIYKNSTDDPNAGYVARTSFYNYGGNIFIRKYYMYKNKIGLRTGAFIGYMKGNSTATNSSSLSSYDSRNTSNDYFGGLKLDIVYYPVKRIGVSAALANLSYDHSKIDNGAQGHQHGDGLNFYFINNGLSLSVFYVIGKK